MQRLFFVLLFTLVGARAHAGFIEIGSSGSYRKSHIEQNAYDESISISGSFSYYFSQATALELSYTDGQNKRVISENAPNGHVTTLYYKTLGLDFVYTIGEKENVVRPYVKAGGNYIISKRIVDQYRLPDGSLYPPTIIEDAPGLVPSFGAGVKISLTQTLSLKVGVDAWTSRPINNDAITYDFIGRVGLSYLF